MMQDVKFTDACVTSGPPGAYLSDRAYSERNYELCHAVDLIKLSIVLDKLVVAGMPKEQAACFRASGEALLQLMRTENNRIFAVDHPPSLGFLLPEFVKSALYKHSIHPENVTSWQHLREEHDCSVYEARVSYHDDTITVRIPR